MERTTVGPMNLQSTSKNATTRQVSSGDSADNVQHYAPINRRSDAAHDRSGAKRAPSLLLTSPITSDEDEEKGEDERDEQIPVSCTRMFFVYVFCFACLHVCFCMFLA